MSCFKFKMCRKRAYNFNNQPYEPAQTTEGTYRYSTADVDGWDPDTALKVEDGERPEANTTATDKNMLASPSNSDVTFGGNFQDADDTDKNNEVEKGKKKKDKNKKEKKEKSTKKNKNKQKDKEDKENIANGDAEKGQNEDGDSDSVSKEKDKTGNNVDISNMETLPREDRQVVGHSETPTLTTQGDATTTSETVITEAIVTETIHEGHNSREGGHPDTEGLESDQDHRDTPSFEEKEDVGQKDLITSDLREDNRSDTSTPEKQTFTTTTTIIVSNDESYKRKSDMSSSGEGDPYSSSADADDAHNEGTGDHDSIVGMATPYPEPEEQIDVRNIRNLEDVTSHTTEESTFRDAEDGTTFTVTKVIVTETVEVKSNDVKDNDTTLYDGHVE